MSGIDDIVDQYYDDQEWTPTDTGMHAPISGERMHRRMAQEASGNKGGTQTMYSVRAALALGGKCSHCGEKDLNVCDIDHINCDGKSERHQSKKTKMYKSIIEFGAQGRYQLLCANCHKRKTRQDLGYPDKNEIALTISTEI